MHISLDDYRLRRIGGKPTISRISDNLDLNGSGMTTFGRQTDSDHFLDSTKLTKYISRKHARIIYNDEEKCFCIEDTSLNGTYVNHIRVQDQCPLREGDIVIFGHMNGKHISPGTTAPQSLNTEFVFVFENKHSPIKRSESYVNIEESDEENNKNVNSSHNNLSRSPNKANSSAKSSGRKTTKKLLNVSTMKKSNLAVQSKKVVKKDTTPKKRKSSADTKGGKKRGGKKKKVDSGGLEEEWHVEGDACAANQCQRPAEALVNWVQCDRCDQWYHTICIGVDSQDIDDDDDFFCGC